MAATERFSETVKPLQEGKSAPLIASLITQERTQKLDLLIHLITNLKQSLIITGPKGIGKTTLLAIFQERTAGTWPIVSLSATTLLDFDNIQEQLLRGITPSGNGNVAQSLSTILRGLEKLGRQVVLIIDEAGMLLPGLLTRLTQYAATYPALRIVFALTDDALALKRETDPAIDEGHFIEIPALSETQCGEYLQHLSDRLGDEALQSEMADGIAQATKKDPRNIPSADQLYKQSKGIPGKISDGLPSYLDSETDTSKSNSRYGWVVAGLITLASGFWVANRNSAPEVNPPVAESQANLTIPGQTAPEPPTAAEIKEAARLNKPLIPETPATPAPFKGYTRTHEGDALEDFKPAKIPPVPAISAQKIEVKIMPAVPTGMAEADMIIEDYHPDTQSPKNIAITPPVTDIKAAAALLIKQKEQEARKNNEPRKVALERKLKEEAQAIEKAKAIDKAFADKVAKRLAETSNKRIELPDEAARKAAALALNVEKAKEEQHKAAELALAKAKKVGVIEAKPLNDSTAAKPKNPIIIEAKPTTPETNSKVIIAKIPKIVATPVAENTSSGNYVLQLAIYAQRGYAEKFIASNSHIGGLRIASTDKGFAVVYGSFESNAQANAAKQKLPAGFRSAFPKKL